MLKAKYSPYLGKFVEMAFTYSIKKAPEPKYVKAFGHIIRVEIKYMEFKDNDNCEYIIDMNKIWECTLAGKRRTVKQYQKELKKEFNRKFKIIKL
jgi:hypothetical protein